MKRANAVLFSLLMIVSSLAGCIGGEEVDTSEYEDQIAELEEMLEMKNQTIAQREATIDGLEDGMSDATQMIQDHAEGIAILEAYRDSLLVQLENSNNTSAELIVQLESVNVSIASMQSQIASLESLRDNLSTMLNSSNSTIDELEGLLNTSNNSIIALESNLSIQQAELDIWMNRALSNIFYEADLSNTNFPWETDLRFADLRYANLSNIDLGYAKLHGVYAINLQACPAYLPINWQCSQNNLVGPYANLEDANLSNTNLSNANLQGVNLRSADLSNTNLSNAGLRFADLSYANLSNTNLSYANLYGVDGRYITTCPAELPNNWQCSENIRYGSTYYMLLGPYSELSYVNLASADLSDVDLSNSNLSNANFYFADLNDVDLSYANLSNLRIMYGDLIDVDLSYANLAGANFKDASLSNVNLTGADLTGADLTSVDWDNTICPDGTNSDDWDGDNYNCENNL